MVLGYAAREESRAASVFVEGGEPNLPMGARKSQHSPYRGLSQSKRLADHRFRPVCRGAICLRTQADTFYPNMVRIRITATVRHLRTWICEPTNGRPSSPRPPNMLT